MAIPVTVFAAFDMFEVTTVDVRSGSVFAAHRKFLSVRCVLLTAARFNYLGVRCVPFAASHDTFFSVSYGES